MKGKAYVILAGLLAAALFLFLFFALSWNPVVCVLLSVGAYFGLFFLLKPARKIAGISMEAVRDDEAVQKLLEEAQQDLKLLERASREIADLAVRASAAGLHASALRILDYLGKNPEKLGQARRFFGYYLDTASKLLSRYLEFQETGLRSPQVVNILEKTAKALPVLRQAFDKQFTRLMQGELLDVETDIELLERALEMEDGV